MQAGRETENLPAREGIFCPTVITSFFQLYGGNKIPPIPECTGSRGISVIAGTVRYGYRLTGGTIAGACCPPEWV